MARGSRATIEKKIEIPKIDRTAALSEIVRLGAETADLDKLSKDLARELGTVIPLERCTCAVVVADGGSYRLEALLETRPDRPQSLYAVFPLEDDIVGSVIREGAPRLITDLDAIREHLPVSTDP